MLGSRTAASLALVVAAAALSGCGPSTSVGDVVSGHAYSIHGRATTVQLPWGALHVTFSKGAANLTSFDTDSSTRDPGDGNEFVGVAVSFADGEGVPHGTLPPVSPRPPTLTLSVGGVRTHLSFPLSQSARASYIVAPTGESPKLDVEFEGVTQTVTADGSLSKGAAAPLYERQRTTRFDCHDEGWPADAQVDDLCYGTATHTGYAAGAGWARPYGTTWTVIDLHLRVGRITVGHGPNRAVYAVTRVSDESSLDGTPSTVHVQHPGIALPSVYDQLVFPEGRNTEQSLQLRIRYSTTLKSGPRSASKTRDFTVTATRRIH